MICKYEFICLWKFIGAWHPLSFRDTAGMSGHWWWDHPCRCQQSELLIHMYSVFKAVTTSCSWPYLIRAVCSHKIKIRDCAVLPLSKCFFSDKLRSQEGGTADFIVQFSPLTIRHFTSIYFMFLKYFHLRTPKKPPIIVPAYFIYVIY